jgi:hypothetical protein
VAKTRSSQEVLTNIETLWQHAVSTGGDLIEATPSSESKSSPSFKRISDLMEDAIVTELVANDEREAPPVKEEEAEEPPRKRGTLGALGALVNKASKRNQDDEEDTSPKLPSFEETKARMDRVSRLKSPYDDDGDAEYALGGDIAEYIRNIVRDYLNNEVEDTVRAVIQSEVDSYFRKHSNRLPAPALKAKKAKKKVTARKAKKAASAKAKKAQPKK